MNNLVLAAPASGDVRPNAARQATGQVWRAFAASVLALYAPFSWLVLSSGRWDGYRLHWLKLWPVLPGFFAGLPFHPNDAVEFTMMGVACFLLLAILTGIGRSGGWGLVTAIVIGLFVSIPSSIVSYAAYLS